MGQDYNFRIEIFKDTCKGRIEELGTDLHVGFDISFEYRNDEKLDINKISSEDYRYIEKIKSRKNLENQMLNRIKEYLTTISPDNEGTHYHWTFMDMAFPTVNLVGKLYKNPSIDDLKELMIKQRKEDSASAIRFFIKYKN